MNIQIIESGTHPKTFDIVDTQLSASTHIIINDEVISYEFKYEAESAKFIGGTIESKDGFISHKFIETGFLNEI